jgi:predicted dehydrogenase
MTSKQIVNITAIGTGGRLRDVIRRVLAAGKGQIKVAAVYDPDPLSVESFIAEFGNGATVYDNEEAAIAHAESEWVFIGSWNCHHARQIQLAFSHGKNVFCEKPLATTIEDCLAVRDAMRQSRRVFAFGLVLRYSNHYRKIRELLDNGAIGELVSFEFNETLGIDHGAYIFGNWRREREHAGTHILEKCCHDLDLANWLTDSLPVKVASFGGKNVFVPEKRFLQEEAGERFDERSPYVKWKCKDARSVDPFSAGATIMDNQVVILEYANGTRATFHTNAHSTQPERRFYLNGTKGAIRADLLTGKAELTQLDGENKTTVITTLPPGDMHGGGDEIMAEHLAGCLLDGREPLASVTEGICSAFTAFAIDRAADTNSVVELAPMWNAAGIDPHDEI